MLQSFEKCEKQPFKKRDFCSILWGDFFHSAKMISDFRKCVPVMCRIDENAITSLIIFKLPFKIGKKISLYMREIDSAQQVIRKMHKCAAGFYAGIWNIRYFSKKPQKWRILPLHFREKCPLLWRVVATAIKMTDKLHKWAAWFYADIRNFRLFSQKQRKWHILPLHFRGKSSLIIEGLAAATQMTDKMHK